MTFECEPGTLQQHKLEELKQMGVTRLSLGIENFDDKILEANGRAHLSSEIFRSYAWARALGFPQINIDLIAGMVGEDLGQLEGMRPQDHRPSRSTSATIYQMELPFNTVFVRQPKELPLAGESHACDAAVAADGVADWPTKRAWVDYAFAQFAAAGYHVSSAYTVVKNPASCKFVYRDSLPARRRHVRNRRRLRPRQRGTRAERRPLGRLCRHARAAASCPWAAPSQPSRAAASSAK
ncbi:MAG: radical SAM protein [Gemmataceae bacterium]